jgi:hypothetical protein
MLNHAMVNPKSRALFSVGRILHFSQGRSFADFWKGLLVAQIAMKQDKVRTDYLLEEWGGKKTWLLERGVRFDFHTPAILFGISRMSRGSDLRAGTGFGAQLAASTPSAVALGPPAGHRTLSANDSRSAQRFCLSGTLSERSCRSKPQPRSATASSRSVQVYASSPASWFAPFRPVSLVRTGT